MSVNNYTTVLWPNRRGVVLTGGMVTVDPVNGSDSSGTRGNMGKPFATLTGAKNAAVSGDTIVVLPGTYHEHDLLKNGVNWFFYVGAIVDYTITHTDSRGIWDDQGGAATSKVTGQGVFKIKDTSSDSSNPNTTMLGGVVVITNGASDFRIEAAEFNAGSWVSAAAIAVQVSNCSYCEVKVGKILDPFFGTTQEDPSNPGNFLPSAGTGIVWIKGEMYVRFDQLKATSYGIWCDGPNDLAVDTNLWVEGSYCESNGAAAFYGSGKTGTNYRVWVHVKELISTGSAVGSSIIGGGRYYLVADKMASTLAGGGAAFSVSEDTGTRATVWLNVQKMASFAGPILTVASGVVHAAVLNFEDLSACTSGVSIAGANAELHLQGGYVKVLNGKGVVHSAGVADLSGLKVDTSNTNAAANDCVSVSGAGLVIRNCVLISGAAAQCADAAAPQTITNYGSVGKYAKGANVTVNVQAILVDANVV